MDKKLIKAWVKALRSGKYKQGHEALRRGNEFCCLGVVCSVLARQRHKAFYAISGRSTVYITEERTAALFGLEPYEGGPGKGIQGTLARMNDNGKSFKAIADYIEKRILNGR